MARGFWFAPPMAVILLVGALGTVHGEDPQQMPAAAGSAVPAAAALPLAWWRPRTAIVVAAAAVGGYFALGLPDGPIFLALPLTVFVAARRLHRHALWPVLLPALALVITGLGTRALRYDGVDGFVTGWQMIGQSALSLGAGLAGRWLSGRAELRAERARRSATEEQLRMAQSLHDGVGHGLAVITMHAQVALHLLEREPVPDPQGERLRRSLEAIRSAGQESLTALRLELATVGTGAARRAPAPGIDDLSALLERIRAGGLNVQMDQELPGGLSQEVGQVVYAVVQEALTNVLRHARARRASVGFDHSPGRLTVRIEDDGVGRANASGGTGMGIAGMRRRVEEINGNLDFPDVASGFVVSATFPVAS